MREVKIFLGTIERVKDFVNAVTRLDCDMDIVSGRYVIDAKSIMGIFSVDLSNDQLLLIGGTALTLVNETGETQSFPSGSSKRFLVKDGKIKAISDKEFRSYNGGKDW